MTAWVQRRSFQGRLTTLIAIAVGLAIALGAIASYFAVSHQLNMQVDNRLDAYSSQVDSSTTRLGPYASKAVLGVAAQEGNIVELVPQGGSPILLSTQFQSTSMSAIPPTAAQRDIAGQGGSTTRLDTVSHAGIRYRVITMAINYQASQGSPVLPASLLIATPLTATVHTLDTLRLLLYLLFLAGLALAIILGLAISRLTLRPVRRLTAAAEHVAATQDLDASIEVESRDELGRLANSFNEMLAALGASRQQQAQLVSDAGHELRTPLTSLRTNVELMMRAKQLPEADQRELYGDITAQVEELTTLIGDLVELARQDEQQPEPVEVRLDTIVERSVQRAERRAPSVAFDVELTAGSVRAQPPLLERAVLNVLDNAAKWAPTGTTVRVRLRREASWILEVSDDGPGIAAEDLPHIFDRFYRAPTARAMPGSGLGLAIVHQVIQTHGGRVGIVSPVPGGTGAGTLVHIELPVVAEQEPPADRPAGADPAQVRAAATPAGAPTAADPAPATPAATPAGAPANHGGWSHPRSGPTALVAPPPPPPPAPPAALPGAPLADVGVNPGGSGPASP